MSNEYVEIAMMALFDELLMKQEQEAVVAYIITLFQVLIPAF